MEVSPAVCAAVGLFPGATQGPRTWRRPLCERLGHPQHGHYARYDHSRGDPSHAADTQEFARHDYCEHACGGENDAQPGTECIEASAPVHRGAVGRGCHDANTQRADSTHHHNDEHHCRSNPPAAHGVFDFRECSHHRTTTNCKKSASSRVSHAWS